MENYRNRTFVVEFSNTKQNRSHQLHGHGATDPVSEEKVRQVGTVASDHIDLKTGFCYYRIQV